jgi:hypothetical protein
MEKYDQAIQDLSLSERIRSLDIASLYNKHLALGLTMLEKKEPEEALFHF